LFVMEEVEFFQFFNASNLIVLKRYSKKKGPCELVSHCPLIVEMKESLLHMEFNFRPL
jgi:hypothetical protein